MKKLLTDTIAAEEAMRHITEMGISERTLKIAKKNLGVISERKNGQWFWRLPNIQECKGVTS